MYPISPKRSKNKDNSQIEDIDEKNFNVDPEPTNRTVITFVETY